MEKEEITIFWFRRDLRLEDNNGLYQALKSGKKVYALFLFDTEIIGELKTKDPRVNFIFNTLIAIGKSLAHYDASLQIHVGKPMNIFSELFKKYTIDSIYCNEDYEPYGVSRDAKIEKLAQKNNSELKQFKDHVIYAKNEVVKKDKTAYKVFTPFSKIWKKKLEIDGIRKFSSEKLLNRIGKYNNTFPSLKSLGFEPSAIIIPEFNLNTELIKKYQQTRNFPAIKGTSRLGVHLRFGTISIRKCVEEANKQEDKTFLNELIWREFFMQILWFYPKTHVLNFKEKYDSIVWRNDPKEYKAWCEGETGYPIVDAGMRELNETGFMHNRVRMITASFLCKHLLIDWRWGEAYFASKLLDFDLAQNVGNWQWVAGTGCDAAPYFRIFNPTEQTKKFDNKYTYINKWVKNLNELTYPKAIVEHKEARERCLRTYKLALNS